MATRLALPKLPRIDAERIGPAVRGSVAGMGSRVPLTRRDRKQLAWQLVFLPWWLWSDIPAPRLPERDKPFPAGGLAGDYVTHRLRSIARRTWLQRALTILARSLWLVALVAVIWQAIEIAGGPDVRLSAFPWIGVAIGIPTLILVICSRPSNVQVARMLDRSFRLQERMVTALVNIGHDIPAPGEQAGMRYLQVADAANALTVIKGNAAFRVMPPVRELVLGMVCGLAFASLFFLRGGGGDISPLQPAVVPEFIPAAQRFVNTPQEALPAGAVEQEALSMEQVQELLEQSNNARQDLLTLAEALQDHAFTRSAAQSLNQGDYEQAASTLREISDQAPGLSESERDSLASDLESAAAGMTGDGQQLADAATDAAEGLREGGSAAQEGIEGVAEAVEETGASITPSEALDDAMQQAQQSQQSSDAAQSGSESSGSQSDSLFDENAAGSQSQPGSQAAPGQNESSGQGAESEEGSGSDSEAESADQSGADSGPGEPGAGQPGAEGQVPPENAAGGGDTPTDDPESMDRPPPATGGESSSTGDGAGSASQGESESPSGGASAGTTGEELPEPSEADVSNAQTDSEEAPGEVTTPGGTVTLNRSPNGQAVPVLGAGSQTSLGSGAGMSAAGGGTAQGEVGDAGPDSNHVPGEYRSIVESYFSTDGE